MSEQAIRNSRKVARTAAQRFGKPEAVAAVAALLSKDA